MRRMFLVAVALFVGLGSNVLYAQKELVGKTALSSRSYFSENGSGSITCMSQENSWSIKLRDIREVTIIYWSDQTASVHKGNYSDNILVVFHEPLKTSCVSENIDRTIDAQK